ncbi:lipase/serine esterase [Planoprotostelium fungivorum]|uniref:Lipase/serine esterase n=1 Tax=Planoprotostelium fungivorum TaxID=1890364 RepID=A0A2P6NS26_9EUKA|nr:lipase/serine esterase [Planoprotostelium fungivorum]
MGKGKGTFSTDDTDIEHLIVLVHGMGGDVSDLSFLGKRLRKLSPNIAVYYSTKNSSFRGTYDGINTGGLRLKEEFILTFHAKVMQESARYAKLKYLSMIGHSLGIGKLYDSGYFERIKPLNFITLATPHVGSGNTDDLLGTFTNFLCRWILSTTGAQLILEDDPISPLLLKMTERESNFMIALSMFARRVIYANVGGDLSVRYHTSALVDRPSLDIHNVSPLEKYPSIVECVEVSPGARADQSASEALSNAEFGIVGDSSSSVSDHETHVTEVVGREGQDRISPEKVDLIKKMLKSMLTVSWTRVSVKIDSWFLNHVKIISKPMMFLMGPNGDDVTEHVADQLLFE